MSPLSYLLIIQKSGLPVYAQSFEFDSDEACRSFNKILRTEKMTSNAHLMGGYFSSIQLFADEMVSDKLNLIELGFEQFEIQGLILDDVFFVGIFQHFPGQSISEDYLKSVARIFFDNYSLDEIHDDFVSHDKFAGFTEILMKASNGQININNCRNCLSKCTTQDKGCLPHNIYFDRVSFDDNRIILKEN